jgi:hypothetical protein
MDVVCEQVQHMKGAPSASLEDKINYFPREHTLSVFVIRRRGKNQKHSDNKLYFLPGKHAHGDKFKIVDTPRIIIVKLSGANNI